jgi:hypothetical protein
LRQRDHVLIDAGRGRVPLFPVIGQRDPAQIGQRRRDMREPACRLKLRHHVDRHEAVVVFVAVGIIATQRRLDLPVNSQAASIPTSLTRASVCFFR